MDEHIQSEANSWQTGDKEATVTIGSYSLCLRSAGPTRPSSRVPAVIIVHGLGGSWKEWRVAQDMISSFARVYIYERGGYIPNARPTTDRTLPNIVAELKALLSAAGIQPPYVLVGHSFGGYIIRQYLLEHESEVAGMVIKDSAPTLTPFPKDWPNLLGGQAYEDVILRPHTSLPEEDFEVLVKESATNEAPGGISEEELKHFDEYTHVLNESLQGKQALGSKPLSVVFNDTGRDFRNAYEYSLEHGYGGEELREEVRKRLETFSAEDEESMRKHLSLSSNAQFVKATEEGTTTHNSHVVRPAFIVEQVRWVYEQCVAAVER